MDLEAFARGWMASRSAAEEALYSSVTREEELEIIRKTEELCRLAAHMAAEAAETSQMTAADAYMTRKHARSAALRARVAALFSAEDADTAATCFSIALSVSSDDCEAHDPSPTAARRSISPTIARPLALPWCCPSPSPSR